MSEAINNHPGMKSLKGSHDTDMTLDELDVCVFGFYIIRFTSCTILN